jgi:hypothetical protein
MVDIQPVGQPGGSADVEAGAGLHGQADAPALRLSVADGALMASAEPGMRDAVLRAPADGSDPADLLIGLEPVALPVGSQLQIGPFTVVVEARATPVLPLQRDDRSKTQLLAMLETDRLQAETALSGSELAGDLYAPVVDAAVNRARQAVAEGEAFIPPQYSPRLAVLNLVEDLGTDFTGEGRTARLPRTAATTPAAMVGLGTMVVLSVAVSDGAASILLSQDGFSRVAAVKLRRLASIQRGVEWQYTDLTHPDGYDMSMQRMVVGFPPSAGALLCQAWQQRVLAMVKPHGW